MTKEIIVSNEVPPLPSLPFTFTLWEWREDRETNHHGTLPYQVWVDTLLLSLFRPFYFPESKGFNCPYSCPNFLKSIMYSPSNPRDKNQIKFHQYFGIAKKFHFKIQECIMYIMDSWMCTSMAHWQVKKDNENMNNKHLLDKWTKTKWNQSTTFIIHSWHSLL
jgi:hypothetical protein